ncbi:Mobile element protein [Methanosarcina barkeri 3]|uniref:Mobile element protein n=1 Tax=Methanosarcina barkeri 3 TaxID=1434107 RepID=A0A0E3SN01_METBA|nr:Mobile element protein [Methanosarcina barkeri 3]
MYFYVFSFFFTLEDSLRRMFPEEWLRQTAKETVKETGLKHVNIKFIFVTVFWVLTLSFGVRL